MNALQRLELLSEHAELAQAIPTLKGMAKLDSLERLSQIVALLGGKVQDEVQNGNDVNGGTLSQVNSDKPQEIDVSAIDTDLSKYGADNKTAVLNFLKQVQGKYINTQIGKVLFNRTSIDELPLGTKNNDMRAKLVFYVPQTLTQGEYQGRKELYKERKDSFVAFHEFINEVQIDNEMVKHCVKVGERETGEFVFIAYHSRRQFDSLNEKGSLIGVYSPSREPKPVLDTVSNNKVGRSQTGFDNIVLDEANDVNDEYDDVEFDDSTASLFDGLMLDDLGLDGVLFDDISDDTDGWNIQIISITPIQNKEQALFGKTKPVDRNKLYNAGLRLVYADDYSMWSNGHILVKENISDELIAQASNAEKMPVSQLERVIPAKNTQFKLADLATTTNGKKTQLAVLQDEQGNELPVNKIYLQFFIKEFGNSLEYWTNGLDKSPVAIYKGGELIGLIMPMQNTQYEKHSEQEPKQDKPVISELVDPYDESSVQENTMNESNYTQSDDESQILKAELLKLGLSQNGNDFTQSFLRGKYNETNVKLMFGNHALKFEIVQYDKNSRAYPIDDIIDFNKLNANDVITTIKRYIKGYKANGAITKYNSVNMQDVDMLTQLKYQFEQSGFDYVTLHDGGRLGLYLTMKKSDIDVKITLKDEDVEVATLNQFIDEKETFATTDIQGMVDFIQDMAEASKEYQAERDAKQAFSDDNNKLYEYLDKGWFGDGDKEELQPILDKYRHDPRLSEQVAQWEQQHKNWLLENEMETNNTNPNYTQSDIDYMQSIINGTLDLDTVDMDKMIEIGEKDEHDPMYEQALQVISEYLDKLTSV